MTKLKFICTKGLSFSGKSSWAKEEAERLGNCVIITKDDIRADMGADLVKGIRVKESKVIAKRDELIMDALKKGKNIISADTNFANRTDHIANMKALVFPKYRDQYDFEVKDFTDVPLDVILERVAKTDRKEGSSYWKRVVMEQKNKFMETPYMEQDETLEKIILTDSDGCINNVCNRSPYDGSNLHNDTPNEIVVDYLQMMKARGFKIVVMSGLEDKYKENRENWYKAHNVPYDELHMRKAGDQRKDCVIKRELFDEHIRGKYYVFCLIEDRMQMREMYTDMGLSHKMFSIGNCFKEF